MDAAGTMRILCPNTIGLVNLTDAIVLSATGALEMAQFPAGGIGVVSQSDGILGSPLSRAAARGIGPAGGGVAAQAWLRASEAVGTSRPRGGMGVGISVGMRVG